MQYILDNAINTKIPDDLVHEYGNTFFTLSMKIIINVKKNLYDIINLETFFKKYFSIFENYNLEVV